MCFESKFVSSLTFLFYGVRKIFWRTKESVDCKCWFVLLFLKTAVDILSCASTLLLEYRMHVFAFQHKQFKKV